MGDLKELCMKAAFKHGLSVYDASYLSLSRLLNSNLYTADEKFIAKTKGRELSATFANTQLEFSREDYARSMMRCCPRIEAKNLPNTKGT